MMALLQGLKPNITFQGLRSFSVMQTRESIENNALTRGKCSFFLRMQVRYERAAFIDILPRYLASALLKLLTAEHHLTMERDNMKRR